MKKIAWVVFLCAAMAAMVACGRNSTSVASHPAQQTSQTALPSAVMPQSSPPRREPRRLASLDVVSAEGLSNDPEGWWFGSQRQEDGTPVQCAAMQRQYGALGLVALGPDDQSVYLTFDFGYETGYSADILDTLQHKQAQATFFVTLNYPRQHPGTVARMLEEGHAVGGHSDTHPGAPAGIPGMNLARRQQEIGAVAQELLAEYGYKSRLFRFPEGIYSQQTLAEAALLGQHSVFWSYAYLDYDAENQPPVGESLEKALNAAHPGAIYLLHPQATNAAMLGDLIDGLREKGYEIGVF